MVGRAEMVERVASIVLRLQSALNYYRKTLRDVVELAHRYKEEGKEAMLVGLGNALTGAISEQIWRDDVVPLIKELAKYNTALAKRIYNKVSYARNRMKEFAKVLNTRPPTEYELREIYDLADDFDLSLMI